MAPDRRTVLRWGALTLGALIVGCDPDRATPTPEPRAGGSTPPRTPTTTPAASPSDTPRPSGAASDSTPGTPSPSEAGTALAVLCREAWGAREARGGAEAHTIRQVTVHHSAVPLTDAAGMPQRLRGHQAFHMRDKGWPDIAYHYAIGRLGEIYELRDPAVAGDTATDYDPSGHLLVLVEGDFDRQEPTDAQVGSLALVVAAGIAEHGLDGDLDALVTGHRDHASTTCPGSALQRRLGDVRREIARHLDAGAPKLSPLCGAPAEAEIERIESGEA